VNYQTNEFELIDSRPATTSDQIVNVTVTGNPSRFVNPTTQFIDGRITWEFSDAEVNEAFTTRIDQIHCVCTHL
jgi:hypothetical protein